METTLSGRFAGLAAVAVVLAFAGYWLLAPGIEQLFMPVSDDYCPRAANGEPDRSDQNCHMDLSGVNHVEEWDRAHPTR